MPQSREGFIQEIIDAIEYHALIKPTEHPITRVGVDSKTLIHIGTILELIKQNRFEDLQSYLTDEYALTPKMGYAYSLRDKISSEIHHNINYIDEIEQN
jgi:hypothetical protein